MMKPFDLEAAKAGKPIQRRDGTKMRFIAHVPDSVRSSRVIVMSEPHKLLSFRDERGTYMTVGTNNYDLFMAPVVKTYWANVWADSLGVFVGKAYPSEYSAKEDYRLLNHAYTHLKTISFEIEE